jgi:hypothetical protein
MPADVLGPEQSFSERQKIGIFSLRSLKESGRLTKMKIKMNGFSANLPSRLLIRSPEETERVDSMKKWKQKLQYQFDRFIAKGTLSLVLMLFLITLVSVLVIGGIAFLFSQGESSVFHVWWIGFMQTLDAGNLSNVEDSFSYTLMMVILTLTGIFITSMLISILTSGLEAKLARLQKGTSLVLEKNHTLILGWNDNVPVIVSELLLANLNVKRPVIVILSPQEAMDTLSSLKQSVRGFRNTEIIVRSGNIHDADDLRMCAIDDARSVIISEEDDADTIKTLLAIRQTSFFEKDHSGFVTSIIHHHRNIRVAERICNGKLEPIHLEDTMNRIMAQTCLQPGLSFVYKNLFDFNDDEIYFFHHPSLIGLSVREAAQRLKNATMMGWMRDGVISINPPKDAILTEKDRLIVISEDDDTSGLSETGPLIDEGLLVSGPHRPSRSRRAILAIGFNGTTLDVLREMGPYLEPGSVITMLSMAEISFSDVQGLFREGMVEFRFRKGLTYDMETLEAIEYAGLDTIIVFSNDGEDGDHADSETLLTVLNLKEIERERGFDIPIIIEIKVNKNEATLQYASVDDFIISNVLSNKMLTQVAENRKLNQVFNELLSPEGCEIYLKPASGMSRPILW